MKILKNLRIGWSTPFEKKKEIPTRIRFRFIIGKIHHEPIGSDIFVSPTCLRVNTTQWNHGWVRALLIDDFGKRIVGWVPVTDIAKCLPDKLG